MINRTKQDWTAGATVKVGFLTLTVVAAVPTPSDYAPDAYVLTNSAKTQLYKFVPHNGLEKISLTEGRELIDAAKAHADRIAARAIKQAAEHSKTIAAINDLIAQ